MFTAQYTQICLRPLPVYLKSDTLQSYIISPQTLFKNWTYNRNQQFWRHSIHHQ